MELKNSFSVPVGIDEAWALLLDVERVATCMPGATLESVHGDDMTGRVKVKLGPIAMTYQGTARFVDRDYDVHSVVMEAAGKDVRGSGNAKATLRMALTEVDPSTTECTVVTDLKVTGKPAQFGRGVMADVSARLIDQFARRLAEEVENPRTAVTSDPYPSAAESGETGEAVDLLHTVGPGRVAKAAVPALVVLLVLVWLVARRGRGR